MTQNREKLSARVAAINPSLTLSITAKAKEIAQRGEKVWNFSAGEPDFDTPDHIKAEAIAKLQQGQTKYTALDGLPVLQQAIAEKLTRENGLKYDPKQIIISNGAKHSLFNVIMALCGDGDEIIIPGPYWLSYPEMVTIAGGRPVIVPASEANGFKVRLEDVRKAITPATRAIVVNSPSNPTGAMYSPDELRALGELAVKHDIYIISDEIYEKTVYEGFPFASIGSLSPAIFAKTITVNGFSKAYSMTGWRLGYCAAAKELVNAMSALQSHSTSAPCTFAQWGAVQALRGPQECVTRMVGAFAERRARLHERLTAIKGITCVKPMGAFYMFPNISAFGMDSIAFAGKLLDEQKVAVVPGVAFGSDDHIRLSYACSMDTIDKGMDAMAKCVASL